MFHSSFPDRHIVLYYVGYIGWWKSRHLSNQPPVSRSIPEKMTHTIQIHKALSIWNLNSKKLKKTKRARPIVSSFFSISQRYVCVCFWTPTTNGSNNIGGCQSSKPSTGLFLFFHIFSFSLYSRHPTCMCGDRVRRPLRGSWVVARARHQQQQQQHSLSLSLSLSQALIYITHYTHSIRVCIYLFGWLLYCINVRLSVCLSIDLTSQVIMYSVMYYRERPFQMLQGTVENNLFTVHSLTVRPHEVGENETRTYHTAERERKIWLKIQEIAIGIVAPISSSSPRFSFLPCKFISLWPTL